MSIPSDEDFSRAARLDRERSRKLSVIIENTKSRFMSNCPLHTLYLFPHYSADYHAYVFLMNDGDIEICRHAGILDQIELFVIGELERLECVKEGDTSVLFEYDSDENVRRQFNGNYWKRLM